DAVGGRPFEGREARHRNDERSGGRGRKDGHALTKAAHAAAMSTLYSRFKIGSNPVGMPRFPRTSSSGITPVSNGRIEHAMRRLIFLLSALVCGPGVVARGPSLIDLVAQQQADVAVTINVDGPPAAGHA